MKTAVNRKLDPTLHSPDAKELETFLHRKIISQREAITHIVEMYQMFLAKLIAPDRPVGNLLFLGPTGSGKTKVVEATAEALFGDPHALLKIDCAEFQNDHEICKLIGSPPGYLGHRETHPIFEPQRINQWQTDKLKLTLLLFDEIEKASDALWMLMLGIMDKATLTLGDNRRVDMSHCLIFMTSNLGSRDISKEALGFGSSKVEVNDQHDEEVARTSEEAARKKFTPEFLNRLDKIITFKTLRPVDLREILELELEQVQWRVLQSAGNNQFVFKCTQNAKDALMEEGVSIKFGARHLKRTIERRLVLPLANLIATGQVKLGDYIVIDVINKEWSFMCEAEGAVVPVFLEKEPTAPKKEAAKTAGSCGSECPAAYHKDTPLIPASDLAGEVFGIYSSTIGHIPSKPPVVPDKGLGWQCAGCGCWNPVEKNVCYNCQATRSKQSDYPDYGGF